MQGNLKLIEKEIADLKQKQTMLSTADTRKDNQQRELAESLQKPADMLDELKGQWEKMMMNQTDTMKDLVNTTVNDALAKRKE